MTIDLDELKRLEKAATQGPWDCYDDLVVSVSKSVGIARDIEEPADQKLIVAARNALPELIAEVERLRELAGAAIGFRVGEFLVDRCLGGGYGVWPFSAASKDWVAGLDGILAGPFSALGVAVAEAKRMAEGK